MRAPDDADCADWNDIPSELASAAMASCDSAAPGLQVDMAAQARCSPLFNQSTRLMQFERKEGSAATGMQPRPLPISWPPNAGPDTEAELLRAFRADK